VLQNSENHHKKIIGLDTKVQIFKNPFIFWLSARTFCRNLAIYGGVSFFTKKPLYVLKSYFSGAKIDQNSST
jgi:hypothetical protein